MKILTIFDNYELIKKNNNKNFLCLNGNINDKNSLKYLIEKNKKSLRIKISILIKKKLDLIFRNKIFNKKDILLWKMSSIYEMNTLRTNSFYKLAQLLCLEDFFKKNEIKEVVYYGSDEVIKNFLSNSNIFFQYRYNQSKKEVLKKNYFLRGLIFYINYIFRNFSIILHQEQKINNVHLCFLSYLVHLDKKRKNFFFSTNHWGDITRTVSRLKKKINWHYDFTPSHELPSLSKAKKFLRSFYKDENFHYFLSQYLSLTTCLKVFIKFISITILYKLKIKKFFYYKNKNSKFLISKIFYNEIKESFCGPLLMSNLFYIEIFKKFFNKNKNVKNIFFLLENQPWEKAFLYFGAQNKKINFFGCVNSTTIFWDMRYFHHDKKENFSELTNILVNGNLTKRYLKDCTPNKKIKTVEAIRYKYLEYFKNIKKKSNKKTLILGEQSIKTTLSCLEYLYSDYNDTNLYYDFKPHPTNSKNFLKLIKKKFPRLNVLENTDRDLYKFYKITIVIGSTSAIIEAIYFKTKILIYDKEDNFILSPLFNNRKTKVIDNNKTMSFNLKNNLLSISKKELSKIAFINKTNKNWKTFLNNI